MITSLSRQYRPYLNGLRSQFFLKRLNRSRTSATERGRLHLSYVFIDPSGDFEHIQLPGGGETTPTPGEEGMAEEREEAELPPEWEERRVSVVFGRCPLSLSLSPGH